MIGRELFLILVMSMWRPLLRHKSPYCLGMLQTLTGGIRLNARLPARQHSLTRFIQIRTLEKPCVVPRHHLQIDNRCALE